MRFPLLLAASLLVTACEGPATEDTGAADGTDMSGAMSGGDTGDAFAEQPPTALSFVNAAAMSDIYEIAASNIALDKAEAPAVREFAQMMIADHTRSAASLKSAIGNSGQTLSLPTQLDAPHRAQVDILQSLQDRAFDREYLSQQRAAHSETLDLLKAYAAQGEIAELRQFAQAAIPAVQKHHDWLEDNSSTVGAASAGDAATPAQ